MRGLKRPVPEGCMYVTVAKNIYEIKNIRIRSIHSGI